MTDLDAIRSRAEDPPFVTRYSLCSVCDAGLDPSDVPSEPCGHGREFARSVSVACVPASDARALLAEVEALLRARSPVQTLHGADPSVDVENVNAAYLLEREENERLAAENERLRAGYPTEPRWCDIHQHAKWCEHNGGVMAATGYESPTEEGEE